MTDRFLRACRREPVDATPVWFMRQAGRSLPEYRAIRARATLAEIVADAALCAEVTLQPVHRLGVDAAILFADITTPLVGMGVRVDLVDGVGPVLGAPVRTAADVAALRDLEPREAVPGLLDAIGMVRRSSDVPLIGFAGAPFTLASYLVEGGPSDDARTLRLLLHTHPTVARSLLERLTAMTLAYLAAQVEAGVQAVQVFDSWVGVLGPHDYATFVAPHQRAVFAGLRELGVPTIHFGTGSAGLLPLMGRAGGDVLGVDWRTSLTSVREAFPDRALQGNLDPVLALAPWPAVAEGADRVLADAGPAPGHIFNLGHGVLPETDPDVLRSLVELVHDRTAVRAAA